MITQKQVREIINLYNSGYTPKTILGVLKRHEQIDSAYNALAVAEMTMTEGDDAEFEKHAKRIAKRRKLNWRWAVKGDIEFF